MGVCGCVRGHGSVRVEVREGLWRCLRVLCCARDAVMLMCLVREVASMWDRRWLLDELRILPHLSQRSTFCRAERENFKE